jgi:hypothetical protein
MTSSCALLDERLKRRIELEMRSVSQEEARLASSCLVTHLWFIGYLKISTVH